MTTTPKYTFINRQVIYIVDIEVEAIFISFSSLGGERGWLVYNCLWRLRGIIDRIIGGVGFRGRKHPILLNMGDVVDFWRVADIQKNKRLLLKAEMKVPGNAWLEFKIENNQFIQSAYFLHEGLLGKIYWHLFSPFHYLIFKDMANKIIEEANKKIIKN